ncbi:MAG: nickel pincer cofactor biosynthesis protein LarB [Spirochaetota bacterium]|nr:nickel pincer cofactor biosynthesis protein LarB [Spirochaetota bacterium]
MDESRLRQLLNDIKTDKIPIENAISLLKSLPYEDFGYAKVDHHRSLRKGFPEVIYCEGKQDDQIIGIVKALREKKSNILATRIRKETANKLKTLDSNFIYNELGRVCTLESNPIEKCLGKIIIMSAGTSDLPIVEEAFTTANILGNRVEKVIDVGVAGIHRLLDKISLLEEASVIIVIAGMEGALASVVAGLIDKPIIAVPTSIGYGANFGGLSALLGMLNSCAPTVLTVNIDNGFGAAYAASVINKGMRHKK